MLRGNRPPVPAQLEPELGPSLEELTATGYGDRAGEWSVSLHAQSMRVHRGEHSFVYTRDGIVSDAKIMHLGGAVLHLEGWKTGLFFGGAEATELRRWMGPHLVEWGAVEASRAVRLAWIKAAFALLVWWFGDGWFLLAWAVASLAIGLARLVRPGRWLLLAEAGRSLLVAAVLAIDVALGTASWMWLLLLVVLAISIHARIRKYRFFAPPP